MANAKVDEKMFSAAKILFENGATIAETAKYLKISEWSAGVIRRSESIEEYKNTVIAMKSSKKKEEPQVERPYSVTIQATHYMTTELQKTNEYLKLISSKLAYIVDELCGTKKEA